MRPVRDWEEEPREVGLSQEQVAEEMEAAAVVEEVAGAVEGAGREAKTT